MPKKNQLIYNRLMITQLFSKNNIYIAIISALTIALLLQRGCIQKHETDLLTEIANYKDTATSYKLKNGEIVETNKALVLNSDNQVKALLSKNDTIKQLIDKFKDIKSVVVVKQISSLVHDTIKFQTQIPCDFKPIRFKQDSSIFHIRGFIHPTKLIIDSLSIPNKQHIVVGDKRKGLFGRQTTIDIINSNPIVSTNAISGYVVEEKKWYNNKWIIFGSGAILGGYGAYKLHQLSQ